MMNFIKYSKTIACVYVFICAIAFFTYLCIIEMDKYPRQIYYLDDYNYSTFLSKYRDLFLSRSEDSLDYFIFKYDTLKTGGYKTEIKKYEEKSNFMHHSASSCYFYLKIIDGWVWFVVEDVAPLKLSLYSYQPSYQKRQEKRYQEYRWVYGINDSYLSYSDNKEILNCYEQNFLKEFGNYRIDYLQGWSRKYASFLERVFIVPDPTSLLFFILFSVLFVGWLLILYFASGS